MSTAERAGLSAGGLGQVGPALLPAPAGRAGALEPFGASKVTLSPHAQMMARLQQIALSHSPSAKGLLSDLARKLRSEATDGGQVHLGRLAARIQAAADSGDYSSLASAGEPLLAPMALGVRAYVETMRAAQAAT